MSVCARPIIIIIIFPPAATFAIIDAPGGSWSCSSEGCVRATQNDALQRSLIFCEQPILPHCHLPGSRTEEQEESKRSRKVSPLIVHHDVWPTGIDETSAFEVLLPPFSAIALPFSEDGAQIWLELTRPMKGILLPSRGCVRC